MDRMRKAGRMQQTINVAEASFSELRDIIAAQNSAPADADPQAEVSPAVLSGAAAIMLQSCVRRLLVRARRSRLIMAREVKRRSKQRAVQLSDKPFPDALAGGAAQLKELQSHSRSGIRESANVMVDSKKDAAISSLGYCAHQLLWAIEGLTRVAAAPSEGAACDEMAILLCDTLQASQCEVYPVETNDGEAYLRLNHRVYLPVRYHGLFGTSSGGKDQEPVYASGRPVSYANVPDAAKKDKRALEILEWYEARTGFRELLVDATEKERVQSALRERGYKSKELPYRVAEYGHAMLIPVFSGHNAAKPRPGERNERKSPQTPQSRRKRKSSSETSKHVDPEEEIEPVKLVALVLLVRPPGDSPFTANDEYLAQTLAPHLGHALRRARLLAYAQDQRRQLMKLHSWSAADGELKLESPEDLCKGAAALFASDDVALYALVPEQTIDASKRSGGSRGSKTEGDVAKAAVQFANNSPKGRGRGREAQPTAGKLVAVRRGNTTPIDSVMGLEALCTSGQSLSIGQGTGRDNGFGSLLSMLRRPFAASARSMLCVPAYVPREMLGLDASSPDGGEAGVVPVLIQWANAHSRAFSRSDLLVASALSDTLGRLASTKVLRDSQSGLEERFRAGDQRRQALMESARMLATRMGMDELFTSVMVLAKELMDADRSTLFMVDKAKNCMFTLVADNVPPINIPLGAGLAGAAYNTGQVVNVPDAYQDRRFNRDYDAKTGYRTKSVLCYPIQNSRDEVIAVVQLINKKAKGSRFGKLDEELIAAFSAQLAVSIENTSAIEQMHKSQELAAQQQERMRQFLECCCAMVQGLSAHEVCEVAHKGAMACTDSKSAAIFICPENAPDVLGMTRLDLDALAAKEDASPPEPPAAFSASKPGRGRQDTKDTRDTKEEELELELLVSNSDRMDAVARFCSSVMTARLTLEDEIDLNDAGLPDALKQYVTPEPVRCIATPLSTRVGDPKPLGVVAVWGAEEYTEADQQALQSLAVVVSHLLWTSESARASSVELRERAMAVTTLWEQRRSLVNFAKQLGSPTPDALYAVARQLPTPLSCACVTLYLIGTDPGHAEQNMITQLPPDFKRSVGGEEQDDEDDEDEDEDAGYGQGCTRTILDNGTTVVTVSMQGKGILGHVLSTGKPLRVGDAHIHYHYTPEVDEAVFRLSKSESAMCVVPLLDHTGNVLGLLQASGKHKPTPKDANHEKGLWEVDKFEPPSFTPGDQDFLTLIASSMASEIQLLQFTTRSASEVVDQQQRADLDAFQHIVPPSDPSLKREGTGGKKVLATPEAVFDDLCRTLREL